MTVPNRIGLRALGIAALAAALFGTQAAQAQTGRGFLLKQPSGSVGVVVGLSAPVTGGDLFQQTYRDLTVEHADFRTAYLGGELEIRLGERWDLTIGAGHAKSEAPSAFREFVEEDGSEIRQRTALRTVPFSVGARYSLTERGRRVGRFAWVPARFTPFAAAGAGYMWYRFEQYGDFVDFADYSIFYDKLESSGGGPLLYASAGVDVSLNPLLFLTGEARYAWANGDLDPSTFVGFDAMKLGGARLTLGISVRF